MFRLKPASRLALTIGFVAATIVWIAVGLNLIPDPTKSEAKCRLAITKTLAASTAGFAGKKKTRELQRSLDLAVHVNDNIQSLGIRFGKSYIASTESHERVWVQGNQSEIKNQARLDILANGENWGALEICFVETERPLFGLMFPYSMILFVSASTTLFAWLVLSKSFKYLNPSKVVPKRVRSAFDTLTEGLVLINKDFEIAHANLSMGKILNLDSDKMVGENLNNLGWKLSESAAKGEPFPWKDCISNEESVIGRILELGDNENRRKFFVNSAPIFGDKSECRGAMISFDDVTAMERKKAELAGMIRTLRSSRDEVERQNKQLTFLASYDPLTQCMNRRAFWIEFEELWGSVEPSEMSLIMVDVDHFKSINDTLGHSFGDQVLKKMGETLRSTVSDLGVVCRYGGEEFVVAIPNLKIDKAIELTHQVHRAIQEMDIEGKNVTASIGFSNREFKAMDGQHLLDQADQCLYAAKNNGRNCVVRFDECPSDVLQEKPESETPDVEAGSSSEIPYGAVSGLLSALAFRCPATANHSTRVADLCVSIGSKLLNRRDLYRLEVAALLHDIGKVGVPDAILHKPGRLTDSEWEVMKQHDEIGLQIIRSAFASDSVPKIIEAHRLEMKNGKAQSSFDSSIGTCVAIIKVCDAFDSMIHDSVYRKGMSPEAALQEIVRCTPKQFNIEVVTRLVEYVRDFGVKIRNASGVASQELSGITAQSAVPSAQAANISNYIAKIQKAVVAEDVDSLQAVVGELKSNATTCQVSEITQVAEELENKLGGGNEDFDQVLQLAEEVIGLCDETRKSILESPELVESVAPSATL